MAQDTTTHTFKTGDIFTSEGGIIEYVVVENEAPASSFYGNKGDRVSFAYIEDPTRKIGTMHTNIMKFVR